MRVSKQQIREDIKGLAGLLAPFGITSSEQLAALLRQNDGYPSGAYIRLMLSPWDEPDPSERFCDRFYLLKEYVERSLVGDQQADLLVTLDRVIIRDHYDPSQKIRFMVSGDGHFKFNEVVMVREEAGVPEGALVYVPPDFIGQCQECGTVFFKRSSSARYCGPACRKEARRRRRQILKIVEAGV